MAIILPLEKKFPSDLISRARDTIREVTRIPDVPTQRRRIDSFLKTLSEDQQDLLLTPLGNLNFTADDFGVRSETWGKVWDKTALALIRQELTPPFTTTD